jgi:NAD+ kinase
MRVIVLGNGLRPGVPEEMERLRPFFRQHCDIALEDLFYEKDLSAVEAELVLVLGGDGAILRAARQMGYRQRPVLGVNLGHLGFLADLSPDEMCCCFPAVVAGQFRTTRHLMFEVTVEGDGGPAQTYLGLNEIAVQTAPPFHLIELDLRVDGEGVVSYAGDGLIVSTPIGSTGHSLSAGGPILSQELSAFVISPICPHTLTHRPLVDSADKTYTLVMRRSDPDGAVLVIDGQVAVPLTPGRTVTLRRAPVCFELIKAAGRSYYQVLRDKLHWGHLPGSRPEPPTDGPRSNEVRSPSGEPGA